jgi:hypothetical protein
MDCSLRSSLRAGNIPAGATAERVADLDSLTEEQWTRLDEITGRTISFRFSLLYRTGLGANDLQPPRPPLAAAIDRRPLSAKQPDPKDEQHQHVVVRQVDDVVGRVIRTVPGQVDPLAADLEHAAVLERLFIGWPGRVVVAQQEAPGLLVSDARDVLVEEEGCAGMVGVVVRVDEVGDLVAHAVCRRDLVDGPLDVVADRRGRVEKDDAGRGREERRLVGAVGDPVQVPLDAADVVALFLGAAI